MLCWNFNLPIYEVRTAASLQSIHTCLIRLSKWARPSMLRPARVEVPCWEGVEGLQ